MKISYIDRYGSYTDNYVYYIHYENGDIERETEQTISKEARDFMSEKNSIYQFRKKSKSGEFYHRYAAR